MAGIQALRRWSVGLTNRVIIWQKKISSTTLGIADPQFHRTLQGSWTRNNRAGNCVTAITLSPDLLRFQFRFLLQDENLKSIPSRAPISNCKRSSLLLRPYFSSSGPAAGRRLSTRVDVPTEDDLSLHPGNRTLQGRYLIGKFLGAGGFGAVIAGKDLDTGEIVAIKVLRKDYFRKDPGKRMKRFIREIAALRRFKHPYITSMLELMHDNRNIYLVMEFVPGGDLMSAMKRAERPFREAEARKLFQQIIDAVDFCHSKGVYHRDIKPQNVLLAANGDAKVCDFGLAELIGDEYSHPDGLIHSGAGTLVFLAPEIFTWVGGFYGGPADVWACGCTLYTLATGQFPFYPVPEDYKNRSLISTIIAGSYMMPRYVPEGLASLIAKCLQPDVDKRITIPEIYKDDWFAKDYTPPDFTKIQEIKTSLENIEAAFSQQPNTDQTDTAEIKTPRRKAKPRRMDAFGLLGPSMFDLTPLIRNPSDPADKPDLTRFKSTLPAREILDTMEAACRELGFTVQILDFKMMIRAGLTGRKGPLCVSAEVMKLVKGFFVIEVERVTGDPQEYQTFVQDLSEAIKDKIVQF